MATTAPPEEKHTYLDIPPPPLPEFYLPTQSKARNNSSTSSPSNAGEIVVETKKETKESKRKKTFVFAEEAPTRADKVVAKLPAAPGNATDERATREIRYTRYWESSAAQTKVPRPPPLQTSDVPPLAVYHICRICLRPRSARYHREHPIPVNGVPPPPGICRRCRITSVEEVPKSAEIEVQEESNKMRIGISCIVPDSDYVSNAEMHQRRGEHLMPTCAQILQPPPRQRLIIEERESSETASSEREIVYRHVRVCESTSEQPAKPKTSAESTAQDAIDALSAQSERFSFSEIKRVDEKAALKSKRSESGPAFANQQDGVGRQDISKQDWFVEVGHGKVAVRGLSQRSEKAPGNSKLTANGLAENPRYSAGAASQTVVRESASRPLQQSTYTESDIRRLAREEVEKYRQAERKLDAHPDPYAHGHMVPVERRIEKQADVADPVPWDVKVQRVTYEAPRSHPQPPPPLPASIVNAEMRRKDMREAVKTRQPSPGHDRKTDAPSISRWLDKQHSARDTTHWGEAKRECKKDATLHADLPAPADEVSARYRQPESMETGQRSIRSERRKWDSMTESYREPRTIRGGWAGDSNVFDETAMMEARVSDGSAQTRPRSQRYKAVEVREERDSHVEVRSKSNGGQRCPPSQCESEMPELILEIRKVDEQRETQQCKPAEKNIERAPSTEHEAVRRDKQLRTESARGAPSLVSRSIRGHGHEVRAPIRGAPVPTDSSPSDPPRRRAFDIRWEAATGKKHPPEDTDMHEFAASSRGANEVNLQEHISSAQDMAERRELRNSGSESSKTKWPGSEAPSTRQRHEQSPEREYIYTERIVERVDPWSDRRRHSGSSRTYLQTEELLRTSKIYKAGSTVESEAPSKAASRVESKATSYSRIPPSQASHRSGRPDAPPQAAKGGDGSEHSKSSRVRFASKIEISPTPPRSDASSNQFRIIGAQPGTKKIEAGESAEDLIAEFEERHRGRSRSAHRSMRGGMDSAMERVINVEEEACHRESNAGSRKCFATSRNEYRTSKSQPLPYPLSESPSRERSGSPSPEQRSGHGPYAPELPRPESMHTEWASAHGSSGRTDRRSGRDQSTWAEDLTTSREHAGW